MKIFKNILTMVATYLLLLSVSMPTNVYGKTTGENLAMERLKTIQEYVQVMKNEISQIKTMEEDKLVDEGESVQLELELGALIVKSGIPESGTKVTINSEGTKSVEITDNDYKEEIDELVSGERVKSFLDIATRIHRVYEEGNEKKQAIIDLENREVIESILNTMKSVITDIDITAEKQNYDINVSKDGTTLYSVKEEYNNISNSYSNAIGKDLQLLLSRAINLKDNVFSFAMELVDKVVV